MSKSLIIAEKPSVAKDIAKALGGFKDAKEFLESEDYIITWAVGHLLKFIQPEDIDPKYKAWKLEDLPIIPKKFVLQPKDKCTPRIKEISKLIKRQDVDCLINACDAGREGELIFREIVQYCKSKKSIKRLWLQSMTQESIRQAFKDLRPGEDYENLYQAAQCRSEADWLIGINATRALTRRLKTRSEKVSWSAGRVQTPTLAMLCAKEEEILKFRPSPFWKVKASFAVPSESADLFNFSSESAKEGELKRLTGDPQALSSLSSKTIPHTYEAVWFNPECRKTEDGPKRDEWISDKERADFILQTASCAEGEASETRKNENIASPRLFDLTTLQREANRRFGMSAKHTLDTAQRLYESHKLITYPRTSSKCLPSDYTGQVKNLFAMLAADTREKEGFLDFKLYASSAAKLASEEKFRSFGKIFDDKGITDHFAIIPTLQRASKALKEDEAKIYNLILRRFLAAFYPAAVKAKIERITKISTGSEVLCFRTKASYLSEEGWMAVYGREAEDENQAALPRLENPDSTKVRSKEAVLKSETTQPPARITEARLLSLMENAGKQVEDEDLSSAIKDMGLGTPATRAEIIEALITRGYAERADKALKASSKGMILIDVLKRIECRRLASPELTGAMEYNLNQVEHGAYKRKTYMTEIENYTNDIISSAKSFEYDKIYADEEPLGKCPVCGEHQVVEKMRFYACEANNGKDTGCSFIIWKERNGRYLDRLTMSELIQKGSTEYIEGFKGTTPQTYKAKLTLIGNSLDIESENGAAEADAPILSVSDSILGKCPFDSECSVIENASDYLCQKICCRNGSHKKGFSLPRIVCKRNISHEELAYYLENKRTEFLENFISKYNKPFTGAIILNQNSGRYSFEFAPRASKKAQAAQSTENAAAEAEAKEKKKSASAKRTAAKSAADADKPKRTRRRASEAEESAAEPAAKKTSRKKAAPKQAQEESDMAYSFDDFPPLEDM